MAEKKPCRECKHYEKCCYYGGWTDAQWHRYYRINEGRGDCWEKFDINVYKINFSGHALIEAESRKEAVEMFLSDEYEIMSMNYDVELTDYKVGDE